MEELKKPVLYTENRFVVALEEGDEERDGLGVWD